MTGRTPQVSVVLCVRNGAHLIGSQLTALADQTVTVPWELVVVDNGSTDDTVRMVERFTSDFPVPLRVVDASSRAGICHARNSGAIASRGTVLAFCDCDDVVAPNWVQAAYEATREAALVGGSLRELAEPFTTDSPMIPGGAFVQASFGGAVLGCNFAVRRASYMAIGGFDESLPPYGCDDVEFSVRANKEGLRVEKADEMLVYFRKTDSVRTLLRKTYLSAQAEALVWARHSDRYGARLLPRALVFAALRTPADLVASLRSSTPLGSSLREAVTKWGNLVGYLRLVRGGRAGEPQLIRGNTTSGDINSNVPVAEP